MILALAAGTCLAQGTDPLKSPACVQALEALQAQVGRAAMPAEVAGPILFLASSLSAHMTGPIVVVDGGSTHLTPFPKVFGAPKKS